MIFRESAAILPLAAFTFSVALGVEPHAILVPFGVAECAGIALYAAEVRHRFRDRNGRR